jgi:hypothetical protein
MAPSLRSLASAGAALVSSLVLLAPFALAMLVGAADTVLEITGITVPTPLDVIGVVVAVSMALSIALEGAMVQRHGLVIVDRGGPVQRAGRYLLIGVTVLASVITIVRLLAMTIPWAIEHGSTSSLLLAGLVVLALLGACYRTIVAARDGYEHGQKSTGE